VVLRAEVLQAHEVATLARSLAALVLEAHALADATSRR
jgi:hypothetical protein